MRSRICPVESLQEANPALAGRALRAGDRIRAPFVAVSELEKVQSQLAEATRQREAAERRASLREADAQEIAQRMETQQVELETTRSELAALEDARTRTYLVQGTLLAVIVVLAAGLAAALWFSYTTRVAGQARDKRLHEVEAQYTDLRRSVMDLDVQLQRRMLKLLSWHDTRVIPEREVEEASAPVLDMARKLKERHAS